MTYQSYVTDLHLNLHPDQLALLEKWYEHSRKVSDFFTIAYYPYQMIDLANGYRTEEEIPVAEMAEQWETISQFLKEKQVEDDYISFLGYEWQGAGLDGDHNVYFKEDQGDILLLERYQDLVEAFKGQEVIGIPHHLAYSLGNRGKNWETHDESFSPFVETYSHHGSSERDLTQLAMDRHIHMGPRIDGTTVMDGLKAGYHFGLIASGDNHEVPALVKNGRAGVWAESYTKEAIWNAFKARRTFGFTDSKITVWSEIDGQPQGSLIPTNNSQRVLDVVICGNSKIERIELYRDTELTAVNLVPPSNGQNGETVRFKFKLECGWGPNVKYFPEISEKTWQGRLKTSGKILSVEPIFNSFDNAHEIAGNQQGVNFSCKSQKAVGDDHWMRDNSMKNEGYIFEIEAPLASVLELELDGRQEVYSVSSILEGSQLIVYEDEAKALVSQKAGLRAYPRSDAWYHNAYKAKLFQGFIEADYQVKTSFEVSEPTVGERSYFVKVIQSDGQVAWCSPIWLKAT